MTETTSSWTRLSFSPSTGHLSVEGDPYSVLGRTSEELTGSRDPLAVLPASVARVIIEGDELVRDDENSLVIIPGGIKHFNTVTVIKERAAEYDLVMDLASGVASFSPDGKVLSWNRRMSFLFGPRERDVKGRKIEEVLPAPVLYNWTSVLSSVHMGHEVKIEFRPSGDQKIEGILSRGGPGVIGLFFDSTENYNTTKRLRALNRLNQAYIQSTETGLILLDSRLRVLLSNSAFERISGQKGSLIGLQLLDVLPDESYKWVHDASERLLGEEKSEQTAMVPFKKVGGGELSIRHTIRAVRNEMNQAVNYVCLFEDRSELAFLRSEVDSLRRCISGIEGITDGMSDSESNGICGKIQEITGSTAGLRFTWDPSENLRLQEIYGSWPSGLQREEPDELGFPAFVWRGDDYHIVEGSELGNLAGSFSRCLVMPLGKGVYNKGFILLCNPSDAGCDKVVINLITSLMRLKTKTLSRSEDISRDRASRMEEAVITLILGNIPVPAALFRRNGVMEYGNAAMEKLTGLRTSEFLKEDLAGLIDPDGNGLTLDSLASLDLPGEGSDKMIWRARRRDGCDTGLFSWNVAIVEDSGIFQGDYGFLVSAFPVELDNETASGTSPGSIPVETIRTLIGIITLQNESEILRTAAELCLDNSISGVIEFQRNGETIVSFSKRGTGSVNTPWYAGPSLLLGGREFGTRITNGINVSLLESVCETLSSLRGTRIMKSTIRDSSGKLERDIRSLVNYLEDFCLESVRQTGAVLSILEPTDAFNGFARTMLYSGETASAATELLKTALFVSRENFRIVTLDRFLSGFHSSFIKRGMRPPLLSIEDRLPEVMIIPEAVLQAVSILCRNRSSDLVVSMSANAVEIDGETNAVLRITGLSDSFDQDDLDRGMKNLEEGLYDSFAELAVITGILEASGCRIHSFDSHGVHLVFDHPGR